MIVPVSLLGIDTTDTIRLNRPNLFEDRRKRLQEFTDLFGRLSKWQRLDITNDFGPNSVISKYYDPSWPFSAMFQAKIETLRILAEQECHHDIAARAAHVWHIQNGTDEDNWFEAKRQLIEENIH